MADCCEPGVVRVVARQSGKATMLADLFRQADALLDHAEDVAARLVEVICDDAMAITALTRWKAEATAVIEAWERIWRLLGEPGFIGESKAEATWVEVRDLLDARGELVEAKRAKREAERDRDFTIAMANALMVERDAARAEVAALREHADLIREKGYQEGYDAAMAAAGEMTGKRIRDQIANDIDALHSEYDPSGSGERRHACMDQREHDLLERCAAIARNDV